MKKAGLSIFAAAVISIVSSTGALAGPVQVFSDWARGDMGTAHNATNGQYIGCWTDSDADGPPLVYCEAYDGAGGLNYCFTISSSIVSTLQTIADSSDIEFGWDDSHTCTFLTINNFSQPPARSASPSSAAPPPKN